MRRTELANLARFCSIMFLVPFLGAACAGLAAATNNNAPTAAEIRARQDADEDQRVEEEARRAARRKQIAQDAETDRLCMDPQTTYQENWCAERRVAKEHAFQERMQRERIEHEDRAAAGSCRRECIVILNQCLADGGGLIGAIACRSQRDQCLSTC